MPEAKPYDIPKQLVWEAHQRVRANRGAAGVDGETLSAFDKDLKGNLYKIWNRMSSGSYLPPPVRLVEIPKGSGGIRPLGIPTVADRVAQTAVKMALDLAAVSRPEISVDVLGEHFEHLTAPKLAHELTLHGASPESRHPLRRLPSGAGTLPGTYQEVGNGQKGSGRSKKSGAGPDFELRWPLGVPWRCRRIRIGLYSLDG